MGVLVSKSMSNNGIVQCPVKGGRGARCEMLDAGGIMKDY